MQWGKYLHMNASVHAGKEHWNLQLWSLGSYQLSDVDAEN